MMSCSPCAGSRFSAQEGSEPRRRPAARAGGRSPVTLGGRLVLGRASRSGREAGFGAGRVSDAARPHGSTRIPHVPSHFGRGAATARRRVPSWNAAAAGHPLAGSAIRAAPGARTRAQRRATTAIIGRARGPSQGRNSCRRPSSCRPRPNIATQHETRSRPLAPCDFILFQGFPSA